MSVTAWEATVQPALGGGCSTLDLLKRVPYKNSREPAPDVSPTVHAEMLAIVTRKRDVKIAADAHRASHHVANMATLGELVGRQKQPYVPGIPVTRKLKGGRLMRTDKSGDILVSSRSTPSLSTHATANDTHDTLDQAMRSHEQPMASKVQAKYAMPPEDPRTRELMEQRKLLEEKLLHVTQQMCRKYTKQLFPKPARGNSPDTARERADKWAHIDTMSEPERHALYMGGRFTTQHQRDYYERELQPPEVNSHFHKRDTSHTKYSDSLVRGKPGLRANF